MKKWAWIVALLYGLIIVILMFPVLFAAFFNFKHSGNSINIMNIFRWWPYWSGIVLLVLSQAAFLAVPVRISGQRPVSKRALVLPVITSAFLMGLLGSGLFLAIVETARGEEFLEQEKWWIIALAVLLLTWIVWGSVFFRWSRRIEPKNLIEKLCRSLFRGSILELLVAVPTHIVARCKDYCCAGFGTFWGITFGLAIMLFSFGPGVFFLFVERWKRLHPKKLP